jgi:phosphoglycolate phosphatase
MGRLAGIVFDKDGTLFDFHASWGIWTRKLLLELSEDNLNQAQTLAQEIGYEFAGAGGSGRFLPHSPVIAATPDTIARALLPYLPGWSHGALVDLMIARAAQTPQMPAVPLRPVLLELRWRGLRIGLATNDGEAPARAHLAAAGIADLFDFVAGYDSGHGAKPDPGPLQAFLRETGLAPEAVLMVGDSTHDLIAGRAAGMGTLGVLTGPAGVADLQPFADAVLPDIGAIADWLDLQGR